MKLHKIETGNFMLDGGATFGVVPKTLWEKVYRSNDMNLCNFSARSLLVEVEDKKILIDCGLGDKQGDDFFKYYYRNGDYTLESSLRDAGFTFEDITDVILTHLHFDHVGGAIKSEDNGKLRPTFPNAKYWISQQQWDWAMNPNPREKPSFIAENFMPLKVENRLHFIDENTDFCEGVELRIYHGHTAGLLVPIINYNGQTIMYTADLLPTSAHVPLSWICGYDTRPLVSLEEKKVFLKEALDNNWLLFFEHDLYTECCNLKMTEKGIKVNERFRFDEFLKTLEVAQTV